MESGRRHVYLKGSLAALAILVGVGFCGGIIYAVTDYYDGDHAIAENESGQPEVTGGSLLDYFPHANNDGLYVSFYHGANSIAEMNKAILHDDTHMLEGDITLRYYGLQNQTDEPIMAHPPMVDSDNTLENWLNNIISSKKGIKMDVKIEEVVTTALKELRLLNAKVNQPVWINADVIKGPNTQSEPIDGKFFIQKVNEEFPNVTLSLGWTTGYRYALQGDEYSWQSMDSMLELAQSTPQRITFPIRASLARLSWHKFLWLTEQDERFSMTVWSPTTDIVPLEDRLFLRDNFDVAKMFYDTASTGFVESIKSEIEGIRSVEKVFYTGGSVLDFFGIPGKDAIKTTWAHRANNVDELQAALNDESIMMLEADVRLNPAGIPVMAHTPADIPFSDQTLEEWLHMVANGTTNKGIKLDMKTTSTLEPALNVLQKLEADIKIPVWLNSDVLKGPNAVTIPVNSTTFFSSVNTIFPHATLSPGWTTAYNPIGENEPYTQSMVEEMYGYCIYSRQAITFPVRASLTGKSIEPLKWLLKKSNRYSLTVWHSGQEEVLVDDLVKIRNNFPKRKVFYDLPEDMMNEFLTALNDQ